MVVDNRSHRRLGVNLPGGLIRQRRRFDSGEFDHEAVSSSCGQVWSAPAPVAGAGAAGPRCSLVLTVLRGQPGASATPRSSRSVVAKDDHGSITRFELGDRGKQQTPSLARLSRCLRTPVRRRIRSSTAPTSGPPARRRAPADCAQRFVDHDAGELWREGPLGTGLADTLVDLGGASATACWAASRCHVIPNAVLVARS